MFYTYRHILASILALAVFWIAGCGSSSSSAPRRTTPKRADNASISQSGSIARTTRAVTLKRQGSWNLTSNQVKDVAQAVRKEANKNGLPVDLVYGIIWVESRFNPKAVSPVGARGLMQLMPRTADYLADCIKWSGRNNSFDPDFNIAAGTFYISKLIKQFDGDVDLALAAYNAGPTKIRRWMAGTGLPKVSIEYATMVQTARGFFGGKAGAPMMIPTAPATPKPVISNDELDRLGLTILIAGLSDKQFGLEREDDANPFGENL